ncbi:MAG: hypothetical protein QNJ48_14760 [Desulfobacterales bacterium]|nr:hypothetical protein [Desulfobacterales bacterium]
MTRKRSGDALERLCKLKEPMKRESLRQEKARQSCAKEIPMR